MLRARNRYSHGMLVLGHGVEALDTQSAKGGEINYPSKETLTEWLYLGCTWGRRVRFVYFCGSWGRRARFVCVSGHSFDCTIRTLRSKLLFTSKIFIEHLR